MSELRAQNESEENQSAPDTTAVRTIRTSTHGSKRGKTGTLVRTGQPNIPAERTISAGTKHTHTHAPKTPDYDDDRRRFGNSRSQRPFYETRRKRVKANLSSERRRRRGHRRRLANTRKRGLGERGSSSAR
ncbi:unnamed protein product [Ixodes persulcatus]